MLFLLFQLGEDRYALPANRVVEVLPLVGLKEFPQAPAGVAGAFSYRGQPVPVIDLIQLCLGRPARLRLSTRIILVNYPDDAGQNHLLGLMAERANETIRREPGEFAPSGVINPAAPYLGPIAANDRGLIQWIEVRQLLPPHARAVLFRELIAAV